MPQSTREIRITAYRDTEKFYAQAAPFLLAREAEHNLILGLCASLLKNPPENPPFHMLVTRNSQVLAVAFRIPPQNLLLSYVADTDCLGLLALNVQRTYPTLTGVHGTEAKTFALVWEQLTKQLPFHASSQRLYQLQKVNPVPNVAGQMRFAAENDHERILGWINGFYAELDDDDHRRREDNERVLARFTQDDSARLVLWEVAGQPVSMAGYNSPTPNGIRVSSVYTPPEHRSKGYASACVAQLSQYLLDKGYKYCCLYTDLANPTSNHIYQEIGYTPVCDVDIYEFI